MKNAIYFEYPSEYDDIFEQLAQKLFNIDITDNKTYWIRPFQDRSFIKNKENNITQMRITLSPSIFNYLLPDKTKQKEINEKIADFLWKI